MRRLTPSSARGTVRRHLGIVSYKAVIGQALLGKLPGESVELPTETGSRRVKIVRIEPFTDLAGLHQKVHPLSEPAPA